MTNFFIPLKERDVEEKVKLNNSNGISRKHLSELLHNELFQTERSILRIEFVHTKNPDGENYNSVLKQLLAYKIQAQNLKEQLYYIDLKLKEK